MLGNQLSKGQKVLAERWQRISPPIRPSKGMVNIYEKNILTFIENKPDAVWGLLGCTPEIRNLAGKYQAKITCIDRDNDAYYAYKTLCSPSKYESFICKDWLDLDLAEEFDIVIGDGSMAMIPFEHHGTLLSNIHKMIKPGGFAVMRIQTVSPLVFDTPEKIFEWYRKEKTDKNIYFTTRPFLYALWLNPPHKLSLHKEEFLANSLDLYQKGIITEDELEEFKEIKKSGVTIHYVTREILEQSVYGLFQIKSVDSGGDFLIHSDHPIYFLQKV